MMTFKRTDSGDAGFQSLVFLLDKDLQVRDGDEHAFYAQFNKIDNLGHTIVCYIDDKPIACGAWKTYESQKAEIKRMYVLPEFRGRGIGLFILKNLELWAAELPGVHFRNR
jgi:GNAT superfamily N-acetyltransferase